MAATGAACDGEMIDSWWNADEGVNALDCGAGSQVASGDGRTKVVIGAKRDSGAAALAAMECPDNGDCGGWVEMGRMGETMDGADLLTDADGGV